MKVTRRRTLFYQRRTSNIYRLFGLAVFILAGGWLVTQLMSGEIRSPFDPTATPTRSTNSWVLQGDAYFSAGDLPAAIVAYQEAARVDSSNAKILAELARVQAYSSRLLSNDSDRLVRLSEALESADQAKALAPEDSTVLAIRAFVLDWNADPALDILRTGDKKAASLLVEADQQALRAISLDSQNPLALAFYAEVLVDELKVSQAEQYIQSAIQIGPNVMDVHRVYGYYLESNRDRNQAIQEYQKALEINPNLTFLYISIGLNYRQLALESPPGAQQTELYNQALANFARAVSINDQKSINDPMPYLAIAKTYAQQGEFFAAALNARKAVSKDPTNADLYGQLGNIYKRGRNYETAIIALRCAVNGCSPAESCQALNQASDCGGATVLPLLLTPNSATYYLDLGSLLAAFSPITPSYCTEAVQVLTTVKNAYPDNSIIVRNADDGLSICASVTAAQTLTPTAVTGQPASTPTRWPTPSPTPNPTVTQ